MRAIQIYKIDLINQIYQIMVVSMLKNWSYSHYFIKIICFMSIYYIINLDIVSSCMVFKYLYFRFINLFQI